MQLKLLHNERFRKTAEETGDSFRKWKWVEINDESQGIYNYNNNIKIKMSKIRSNLCDYGDAYSSEWGHQGNFKPLYFFTKRFRTHKTHTSEQKTKKGSIFMHIKNI